MQARPLLTSMVMHKPTFMIILPIYPPGCNATSIATWWFFLSAAIVLVQSTTKPSPSSGIVSLIGSSTVNAWKAVASGIYAWYNEFV